MYNDENGIFGEYLRVIEEAMMSPERSEKSPEEKTATRKFGLTTGVKADTSTKWEMSPAEFWKGTDENRQNAAEEAIRDNRFLDLSELVDSLSPVAKDEFDKGILNDPVLQYRVYWFDIPRVINYLSLAKTSLFKSKQAKIAADRMEDRVIEYFKKEPYWRKRLGFKLMGSKEQLENLSKQEYNEWTYSIPKVATAGGGTGSRLKTTSIKPRTDVEGRGGEASIVSPRASENIEDRVPTATTVLPQTPDTKKLNAYEPQSKGIQDILKKPKEETKKKTSPKKKTTSKKKKVTKESYEPFIKVIPF